MKPSTKTATPKRKARSSEQEGASRKALPPHKAPGSPRRRKAQAKPEPKPSLAAAAPRQSKQAAVIALLRRPEGVTVAEVMAATGWQPHSVRGLFSGTLKKKIGLRLDSAAEERGRVYRILDAAGGTGAGARSAR